MKNFQPLSSLILGGSIVLAAFIVGNTALQIKNKSRVVRVKGLAEKEVEADLGTWSLTFAANANTQEAITDKINRDMAIVHAFLDANGFQPGEINVENLNVRANNYSGSVSAFTADAKITVTSTDINRIHKANGDKEELLEKGILLSGDRWSNGPKYFFTGINQIKSELLGEALQMARKSADEFARDSGSDVGKISRADQGIIVLLPASRVEESHEYHRKKIARVVTTVNFFLN